MNTCRYCSNPVEPADAVRTLSYWNQHEYVCHAACKNDGERQEAIDCQTIDADCNDCKHFKRGELVKRWLAGMVDGKSKNILVNMGFARGHCLRFDTPTIARPHMSSGLHCFEHRRV